jgi:hypothetical protein
MPSCSWARSDPSAREQALELLDRSLQAAREIGMRDLVQRAESLRAQAPAG